MNILDKLKEIDDTTGDIDSCLQILKKSKKKFPDIYRQYKQYWVLVYICDEDINSFDDFIEISELDKLLIISEKSPINLKLFTEQTLEHLLKNSDSELIKIIPYIWPIFSKEKLLNRLFSSKNPEIFYEIPIKIDFIPNLSEISINSYKLLIYLADSSILSVILPKYLQISQEKYLDEYKNKICGAVSERYGNLDNFRLLDYFLKENTEENGSGCFLYTMYSILGEYIAPPCINKEPLPHEINEVIDGLSISDLHKLKDFVFYKMIAINTRTAIGRLLEKKGIDCSKELKLNIVKEKYIEKMPEELALELLSTKDEENADDVISRWRKDAIINNLR